MPTQIRLIFSLILLAAIHAAPVAAQNPQHTQDATILQVIDGDTVIVQVGNRREHVRLIGIDTPESRPNRRAEMQAERAHRDQRAILSMGQESATYTRQILPKKCAIRLEFDTEKRDRYQRLLAYVWLANGSMANEEIVRAGYAYLLSVPPNVRYRERLAAAFSEARSKRRGLWSNSKD